LYHPNAKALLDGLRLSLEFRLQPKGSSSQYTGNITLWNDDTDVCECYIDSTTAKMTISDSLGSDTLSTAVSWNAGDVVEFFIEVGGGVAGKAQYRVNGGTPTVLGTTSSSRAAPTTSAAIDLVNKNTAGQFSAWVQWIAAYANGRRPVWAL
jgi:hypothetical protein